MTGLLITWLVTTVSFLIISRLPIGVEIDSFGKAAISALVFGILNAILRPILNFFTFPLIILTFGWFAFIVNATNTSTNFDLTERVQKPFHLTHSF